MSLNAFCLRLVDAHHEKLSNFLCGMSSHHEKVSPGEELPRVRTHNVRGDPLSREEAPREQQEDG